MTENEKIQLIIAKAKARLKHPTKERLQVIKRRERMKAIMRLKNLPK